MVSTEHRTPTNCMEMLILYLIGWGLLSVVNIHHGPGQKSNVSLPRAQSSSCFAPGCSRAGPTRPQVIAGPVRQVVVDLCEILRGEKRHSHRQ
ncbi:hypothetical protein SETIT_6G241500v2 [Setaria italica]|uniref:Uncharacterized protein n=2 Tax=Setaria TaxID=4554 RepID=A0A368RPW4_SETIT|nr:hypothetical protein SETIT_6G241500v2 [Setaria italica]TKW11667.1 hypothetical protein SEVIR_6G247400v2 [Setaria viridis]